jgi:hypothetical protein
LQIKLFAVVVVLATKTADIIEIDEEIAFVPNFA